MRVFTAIPLPNEVKNLVSKITARRLPIAYVNTTYLHVTLNFFGELTDEQVQEVRDIFRTALLAAKKFNASFDRLVKFHQQLHLTLKPNDQLKNLQKDLENAFVAQGFSFSTQGGSASGGQDRNYYPHVKLGNLHMDKVMHNARRVENFPNEELQQLDFIADKVALFSSKLLLHHAHHSVIEEVDLL